MRILIFTVQGVSLGSQKNIKMKQLIFILPILLVAFSCNNTDKKDKSDERADATSLKENVTAEVQTETKETLEKHAVETGSSEKKVEAVKEPDLNDMVYFAGGSFLMGRDNGLPEEAPAHKVNVKPFYIDKYPVTVKAFSKFIKATGHVTEAERFGDSGVFDFESGQWSLKPKTTWEYPLGPENDKAKDSHPVTHVSWRDALAYAKWAGKRLVTEAEWEFAARSSGETLTEFPWGNEAKVDGKWQANVFQGTVQDYKAEDGYLYTSPVGAFGINKNGLADMCGNVWEWTADVYVPYPGNGRPYQHNAEIKSTRGGSFMYDEAGAKSYTVFFRSLNSSETSLFNTGFRCAYTPEK